MFAGFLPGLADPLSSLTHLLGAVVFAVLGVRLVRRGGTRGRRLALGTFAASCVILLSLSGVYHLLTPGHRGREVLQRLDHAAIFVLIAGTFTAAHGLLFRGPARWGVLSVIWVLAAGGIVLKTLYFDRVSEALGLSLYLGLGWLGLISAVFLWRRHGFRFLQPLLWGALCYTLGGVFEFLRQPVLVPGVVGPHELFHVAVLAGIGWHWKFVNSFSAGP